jgi:hypothetical protein
MFNCFYNDEGMMGWLVCQSGATTTKGEEKGTSFLFFFLYTCRRLPLPNVPFRRRPSEKCWIYYFIYSVRLT